MPLPAILGGVVSVLGAAIALDEFVTRGRVAETIAKKAAQSVLDARGIPLDLDGEVNQFTITAAINQAVMPEGVAFDNLFDREAVKRDAKRIGLDYAAAAFGYEKGANPAALRASIIADIKAEVLADIRAGAGEYLDAAKGLVSVQRLIDGPEPFNWQAPRKFTQKAIKNRERQERFRAANDRVWVAK